MTEQQRERLAAAIRVAMNMQGMTQKELAKKAGTSSGQLCNAMNGNAGMSPTKWQMACEALGLDYDGILAFQEGEQQPEEDNPSVRPSGCRLPLHKGVSGEDGPVGCLLSAKKPGVATEDGGSAMKPIVCVPAGPDRSAPVLEEALKERDKTIAQMEGALKGAAEENRELSYENTKLREDLKKAAAEGIRIKGELDALKKNQSEMIRQAELEVAEEHKLTVLKLKAYFFDKEHPDLSL